jgi:hypothetical protein
VNATCAPKRRAKDADDGMHILHLDIRISDSIVINGDTVLTLVEKSGQLARLCVAFPPGTDVRRQHKKRA